MRYNTNQLIITELFWNMFNSRKCMPVETMFSVTAHCTPGWGWDKNRGKIFADGSREGKCYPCPRGTYNAGSNVDECQRCAKFHTTPSTESTNSEACGCKFWLVYGTSVGQELNASSNKYFRIVSPYNICPLIRHFYIIIFILFYFLFYFSLLLFFLIFHFY